MGCEEMPDGFRLEIADEVVLHLAGDLDLALRDDLRNCVARARGDGRPVTLDFTNVTFLDSSGLGVIMAAHLDAEGDLRLRGVGRLVQATLDAAGVTDILHIDG